jgi:chromosome partitioning protein
MLGFLLSMVNKSLAVHQNYELDLRNTFTDEVLTTVVPLAKDFKEAVLARKPIGLFKPRSAAAKVMVALADEIQTRLDRHDVSEEAA